MEVGDAMRETVGNAVRVMLGNNERVAVSEAVFVTVGVMEVDTVREPEFVVLTLALVERDAVALTLPVRELLRLDPIGGKGVCVAALVALGVDVRVRVGVAPLVLGVGMLVDVGVAVAARLAETVGVAARLCEPVGVGTWVPGAEGVQLLDSVAVPVRVTEPVAMDETDGEADRERHDSLEPNWTITLSVKSAMNVMPDGAVNKARGLERE